MALFVEANDRSFQGTNTYGLGYTSHLEDIEFPQDCSVILKPETLDFSMLKKKTCLLLGAGASKHLGFPLGFELRQSLLNHMYKIKDVPLALSMQDALPGDLFVGTTLAPFFERLAYGNWSSPDAFLEKHREFISAGKNLMCRILAKLEEPWNVVSSGGWYDKLISAIHVDDPHKLKDNGLSVVTFNYDRSLDFRLHKYVEHQFGIETLQAWQLLQDSIPIVHVHGMLGEYPTFSYGDNSSISERAQDIKIISEIEGDTAEFQLASKLLNEADRVVVFGFGFATDNVRRLNFFKTGSEETRDVMVATGGAHGSHHVKETSKWLSQWGLIDGKHHWMSTCNEFFSRHSNPFC